MPSQAGSAGLGGLQHRVGYLLRRAQVWIFKDIIALMGRFDIRPAQFSVLTVIGANPGITQRSLSQTLSIEPARLVLMLDELERRGLAKREPAPNDRRSRMLFLTPEGEAQLCQLTALADEHEARLLRKVGAEERDHLLQALQAFLRE
jgi:DNA-binding MarR family transcriptional regulator